MVICKLAVCQVNKSQLFFLQKCSNHFIISTETTQWAVNWRELPNPAIPIIMVPCVGESVKDADSFSQYNMREIEMIMTYVNLMLITGINGREIKQQDIGIISPYKKQTQKIRQTCEKQELDLIECGTVEMFQGREKPIIIISTVRSQQPTVGFLNNPKVSVCEFYFFLIPQPFFGHTASQCHNHSCQSSDDNHW
jgi:superfamily I DNA and/or RNA helicase